MDPYRSASQMDTDEIVQTNELRGWLEMFAEAPISPAGHGARRTPASGRSTTLRPSRRCADEKRVTLPGPTDDPRGRAHRAPGSRCGLLHRPPRPGRRGRAGHDRGRAPAPRGHRPAHHPAGCPWRRGDGSAGAGPLSAGFGEALYRIDPAGAGEPRPSQMPPRKPALAWSSSRSNQAESGTGPVPERTPSVRPARPGGRSGRLPGRGHEDLLDGALSPGQGAAHPRPRGPLDRRRRRRRPERGPDPGRLSRPDWPLVPLSRPG